MELTHEKIERRVVGFGRDVRGWATPRRLAILACLVLTGWILRFGWNQARQEAMEVAENSDDGVVFDASELAEATAPARPILTHIHFRPRDLDVTATIYDNLAGRALIEHLRSGPITLEMEKYNDRERMALLDWNLPEENETLYVQPGDITIFAGNQLGVYYNEQSFSMTPLGRLDNVGPKIVGLMFGSELDETITLEMELMTQEELDNLIVANI